MGSQLITKDITADGKYDVLTDRVKEALGIVKKVRG